MTTITNSQCKDFKWKLKMVMDLANMKITDNMICAVNPKEATCRGDSGGPLITLGKNGTYQQESPALSLIELLHCCAFIGRELPTGEIFSCTERSY